MTRAAPEPMSTLRRVAYGLGNGDYQITDRIVVARPQVVPHGISGLLRGAPPILRLLTVPNRSGERAAYHRHNCHRQ